MTMSYGITALNELQRLYNGKSIREDGQFALEVMQYINDYTNRIKEEDHILYATLVSGRYVVDAKSIMGIFSLALNQPIDFTYEGELVAELAKEVQVYESQEV